VNEHMRTETAQHIHTDVLSAMRTRASLCTCAYRSAKGDRTRSENIHCHEPDEIVAHLTSSRTRRRGADVARVAIL
jgi:hypothetical protein